MNKAFYQWMLSITGQEGGLIKLTSHEMENDMVVFDLSGIVAKKASHYMGSPAPAAT